MKYIADLHIHSHYSMATSSRLVPEHLEYWARIKGINIIGTGDCIHPGWYAELKEKLEPCENGMYRLRDQFRLDESKRLKHPNIPDDVYFILTGELSSIYKRDGKVRKVHNICVFPDFESCGKVISRLDAVANIRSDGRPILGIDSRVILEMVLESAERSFVIPAHIWTPWFSVLGSKSGFDSIEECYGDLTRHIFAVETGLSSDPPMNWTCSFLDKFRLVSNSDAHSPEKIGREANLFDAELSYAAMYDALKFDRGFTGTIEFFPEEGKYHLDGHRKCGIVWDPLETAKHAGVCPVCGKEVTKGVMYRVAELGDRNLPRTDLSPKEFYSITQMPDLLAEVMGQKNSSSKTVMNEYMHVIRSLGSEFHIFLESEIGEITEHGGDMLGEGIRRLRAGEVHLAGGYDGEFGSVKVFEPGELKFMGAYSLVPAGDEPQDQPVNDKVHFDINEFRKYLLIEKADAVADNKTKHHGLTPEQSEAVTCTGPCLVIAGPGAGKTRILAERINYIVEQGLASPHEIAALTFSNRAAGELKSRVRHEYIEAGLTASTFHSFGLQLIRDNIDKLNIDRNFRILSDEQRLEAVKQIVPDKKEAGRILKMISSVKQGVQCEADDHVLGLYTDIITAANAVDIDDLVDIPCTMLAADRELRDRCISRIKFLLVDEFQDINAAQYSFIRMLVNESAGGLFVIGDPDQAIYGFRGSDVRFIDELCKDYPAVTRISLTRSFRCDDILLKAAGQVIGRTDYLNGKGKGVKVRITECESDRSEADLIASSIERMMGGVRSFSMDSGISDGASSGLGFSDFGVLCRSAFMFGPLIEAFANHGIPSQVVDTEPFYTREPYRRVVDLVRRVYNDGADASCAEELAVKEMLGNKQSAAEIFHALLSGSESGYDKYRVDAIFGEVYDFAEFLRAVALRKGTDDFMSGIEAVSLITIHASKGLEFDTVFIPGCEDGIIPFSMFGEPDIAEEERIFYVGLTRGSGAVYITHAKKRVYKGRVLEYKRSRFLDRIEKRLIELEKRESLKNKKDDNQLNLF
ncbi:MAG TPA: UvrD-helicase domain-containing protein [Spirochaetota bacterium]|nr:UvrD-helicase domain-containing protein [Spirochaetota bacterium]